MIVINYQTFRPVFALVGAPLAADGFPVWPVAKLNSGGFDDGITIPTIETFPFNITINDYAADASFGVDQFDWWISQRTDVPPSNGPEGPRGQCLLVAPAQNDPSGLVFSPASSYSGTISIDLFDPTVAKLIYQIKPSDTDDEKLAKITERDNLAKLFKDVHIYVQRRSDKAIQWSPVLLPR